VCPPPPPPQIFISVEKARAAAETAIAYRQQLLSSAIVGKLGLAFRAEPNPRYYDGR
jgi:hypothetical protein